MESSIFGSEIKIINVGIKLFYESFKQQNVPVCHVGWKPSLSPELSAILSRIL